MVFLLRILILALLIYALISLLQRLLPSSAAPRSGPASGGRLVKDPICGTYVAQDRAIQARDRSEVFYFCSDECRRTFLANTRGRTA